MSGDAADMTVPLHLIAALADRYVIERELGRGGMATVYLARDLRRFAEDLHCDPAMMLRIAREKYRRHASAADLPLDLVSAHEGVVQRRALISGWAMRLERLGGSNAT
jgi:serine/threonine protein kinase